MSSPKFQTDPPPTSFTKLSYPSPHILLITLSRPSSLNCINTAGQWELDSIYSWYDAEPSLRCCIVTGEGRAFCAGADLKEWQEILSRKTGRQMPASGFGGLSRRSGLKPVIAAVNGLCLGGGFEMAINADMVLASTSAKFGLPEVKRGVVAIAGALPRVVRTVGKQRAMELALTGRMLGPEEARDWGLVNEVVDGDVVAQAVVVAKAIAENSPDSVIVGKAGIGLGWEGVGAEEGSRLLLERWQKWMENGENMSEGLRAFVEKRRPNWRDSKL